MILRTLISSLGEADGSSFLFRNPKLHGMFRLTLHGPTLLQLLLPPLVGKLCLRQWGSGGAHKSDSEHQELPHLDRRSPSSEASCRATRRQRTCRCDVTSCAGISEPQVATRKVSSKFREQPTASAVLSAAPSRIC